jgi:hypothetical protein
VSVGLSARVSELAPQEPAVTAQSALPDPSRVVATPSAVEAVEVAPRPVPSICVVACAAPSSPLSASAPAWAEQPPAVIAQSAAASVARVRGLAGAVLAATVAGVWVCSPFAVVAAEPVQPVAALSHRELASAEACSSTRTRVAMSHPPVVAPHFADALASPLRCSVGPATAFTAEALLSSVPRPVLLASQVPVCDQQLPSAPSRSARPSTPQVPVHDADWAVFSRVAGVAALVRGGPVVSPEQPPPEERHAIVAPSLVARVDAPPSPLPNSNRAFATTASAPSPLREDELHDPPARSHDALALLSPDPADTPHPDDTPAKATHLSPCPWERSSSLERFWSRSSAVTARHSTNAPLAPHPAAAPSPASETVSGDPRPVACRNWSVCS